MAGHQPLFVYLFVYLTLSAATVNAVIIEEQWIAVKDWFSRIKNFITDDPVTTTTAVSRFIPRGTRSPLKRQQSRLHLNAQIQHKGCEIDYLIRETQSLLTDDERVHDPLTFEYGKCLHDCYRDKYTGKWICCQEIAWEAVELQYYRNGSTELRIRSVENAAAIACDYREEYHPTETRKVS